MSITAECTACGRKYQAPASMAGKRVRCKQCGNVFALPDMGGDEQQADLDALAALEKSYHSVDGTDAGGHYAGDDESQDDQGESVAPLRTGRSSARFNFPLARELDQWLPLILTLGGLLWLGWASFNANKTGVQWMPVLWIIAAVLAYAVVVAPLILAMIRRAGKQLGYYMPTGDRFRAFGAYLPAFIIGGLLWTMGEGTVISLVLGCVVGAMLSTLFLWLLFRLQPSEIAPSATYALVGFAIGMAIVSGVYFGLNKLLVETLVATKSPDVIPASPFAPVMSWITDEQRRQIAEATTKPAPRPPANRTTPDDNNGTVTTTIPTPTPIPQPNAPSSPIVRTIESAPMTTAFDEMIRPLTESPYLALSKVTGDNNTIELWDTNTWARRGSVVFKVQPDPIENRYVLSPDGDGLARITHFPGLLALVSSISRGGGDQRVNLNPQNGEPELIGFLDGKRILIRWRGAKDLLEVREVGSDQTPPPLEVLTHERRGATLAISRRGNLAAVAARLENVPTLRVYDLEAGRQVGTIAIRDLDARWPVEPTGMAFSFDNKQIAILFERGGAGLLLSYNIDAAQGTLTLNHEHVFSSGPLLDRSQSYLGTSLHWLPGGTSWLLWGQGVFDTRTGRKIEELGISNVETCRVVEPNVVELSIKPPTGPRQIRILRLDLEKIATLSR